MSIQVPRSGVTGGDLRAAFELFSETARRQGLDAVAARAPTATQVLITGAGPFPHLETPGLFSEAVRSFLAS